VNQPIYIVRVTENNPVPGILILRLETSLCFFNANVAREAIVDLVTSEKEFPAVIPDTGAATDPDLASMEMLCELLFAYVRGPVRDRMRITGLSHHAGDDNILALIELAGQEYRRRFPEQEGICSPFWVNAS
jgi:hypothetical protein